MCLERFKGILKAVLKLKRSETLKVSLTNLDAVDETSAHNSRVCIRSPACRPESPPLHDDDGDGQTIELESLPLTTNLVRCGLA